MARFSLIDDLIIAKRKDVIGFHPDAKELAGAQTFKIDNVDEYLHAHIGDYRSLEGFPNWAPPFENFFMFSETSHMKFSDGRKNNQVWPQIRYGVWFLSCDIENATSEDAISLFSQKETNRLILKRDGGRWWVSAIVFDQADRHSPFIGMAQWGTVIKGDGSIMPGFSEWRFSSRVSDIVRKAYLLTEDEAVEAMMDKAIMYTASCGLAISLLHCRNVSAVEPTEDARGRYRRQEYERQAGAPAAQWKVLDIRSMQRVLRESGDVESHGMMHALHICRGHFKDYREKGLFGRNKGIYWWDQHMRGDESQGVVIKDYAVGAPQPETTDR